LYELSYRTDLQRRIVRELCDGEHSETLECVIKEALRLYPAVHLVARTALRDVTLGPYLVRQGEEVVLPLYTMQRSAKLFERPTAFEPERWAARGKPVCPRHASLPFSAGPRVCTGQAIAMAEMRTLLAAVLRGFELAPLAPRAPRVDAQMTLAPAAHSTQVRIVRREL
jgi:cytochrome P450